ncbi:MAG: SDR family oxidoreductase [Acidobacteriaceae bacterium]
MNKPIAFVTGSTGLLGNNLVRQLVANGFAVRALARSKAKAERQFTGVEVQVVEGDMVDVDRFAAALRGVDVIFHTAAYFRDSYKGGSHWKSLYQVNVLGTRALLHAGFEAGVRRFVHTSSVAVLHGRPGQCIDESMLRKEEEADDYYRSKILSDREVLTFLEQHPEMWAAMVLPGWMHGPGDIGPTSAGQTVLDFANGKLPGIIPGSFSVVDARDVANAMILADEHGSRGERYLAAGHHMTMAELFCVLEQVTGVKAPTRRLPLLVLYVVAAVGEIKARITRKPVLLSWATARLIAKEANRSRFSQAKSERELGLTFHPVEVALRDEVAWYRNNGWLPGGIPTVEVP